MPFIKQCGDEFDELRVWALMLFPDKDDVYRHQWVSVIRSLGMSNALDYITLLQDTKENSSISTITHRRSQQGFFAGLLLAGVYEASLLKGSSVSSKAVIDEMAIWQRIMTHDDGTPVSSSPSTMRNHKKRFAPVAHLWASYVLTTTTDAASTLNLPKGLELFLCAAAGLQDFGLKHIPPNSKTPYLDAGTVIRIPPQFPQILPRADEL